MANLDEEPMLFQVTSRDTGDSWNNKSSTWHFFLTCWGEVLHSFLVVYLRQAVKQEVQAAETVSQHRQQSPSWATCRAEDLEGAAGQLILTAEAHQTSMGVGKKIRGDVFN